MKSRSFLNYDSNIIILLPKILQQSCNFAEINIYNGNLFNLLHDYS